MLKDLIGGKLSHEIISLEPDYPYFTEREEPFLTISLDIKNKKNLAEALDLYIKPDILEGENMYFCDQFNRKMRVKKRCSLKTLPHHFIITLKRFEFDYNTMTRLKINDYFEFPMEIDLKKWTKQVSLFSFNK
jgi:ubiquitin C-terminal hydrolase